MPHRSRAPRAQILSNGRYRVLLSGSGGGYSALGDLALTRWSPDATRDADGLHLYVRDVESGAWWCVGRDVARRDDGVEGHVEVAVAAEFDAEVRLVTLVNRGERTRRLELTTYAELVLNTPAAYAAHPAFSKLFVQTAYDAGRQALLAWRRLRSPGEEPLWLAHLLVPGPVAPEAPSYETDRARFLGRGRTPADPSALDSGVRLSGTVGNVLDPVVALRRTLVLRPGERARLAVVLAAAGTRAEVESLADRFSSLRTAEAAVEGAEERARSLLDSCEVPDEWRCALPALTGELLYSPPAPGLSADLLWPVGASPLDARAAHGLPGADPLALVRVDGANGFEHLRAATAVVRWWREHRLAADLLVLCAPGAPREGLDAVVAPLSAAQGRVAVVAEAGLSAREAALLRAAASVVLDPRPAPPARASAPPVPDRPALAAPVPEAPARAGFSEPLRFFNGHGGFSEDGSQYVVRLPHGPDGLRWPPLPWTNVVANESTGFIASESGTGCTWSVNSRLNRLTPWHNDPVSDAHGEALYVRDEESGDFWSPTPGPAPGPGDYEARHGFGYTVYRHAAPGIDEEVVAFVPRRDPLRIVRVRVTNRGERARRLSVFSYARWVLGGMPEGARFAVTRVDPGTGAILAVNRANGEFAGRVAFAAAAGEGAGEASRTADRAAFLGHGGGTARPAALLAGEPLDGRAGAGLDPCAAFQLPVRLAPGESAECVFLLGEAADEAEARALVERYRAPRAVADALDGVRRFWRDTVSGVRIETPSPELDLMVNGWLPYQDLSCRLWGRSALYQSGGAFGFRDQLQDAAALVYLDPAITRAQIVLHAAHQFAEGDVMHWWHPPLGRGIRTRFSDDLLWLPHVTAFYVETTGDTTVLDEQVRYLSAPPLDPGEDERFLLPTDSGERGSVFEHCCRALDRSLTRGAHGLPLMGTGDWNDGMNRVGREGRGESVWLGFFLYDVLGHFLPLAGARGDDGRVARYRAYRERLGEALNGPGWDGEWYRRAYYDNGAVLGSRDSDECRIDTIAQAWAVLSGAAPPERARKALDAMDEQLVSEREGIIRLLTPPFDRTPNDPGYIKGYLPGVRENGGQYTHGALWAVRALAGAGRCERAAPLLEMLSPVAHSRTPGEVAVYRTEPYVVAADVYGVAPHVGRGGWTWYTGSAGWMYRVMLESVLGFEIRGGRALALRPCIPESWPGFRLRYRLPGGDTVYDLRVTRGTSPDGLRAREDGHPLPVEDGAVVVPLRDDDREHVVEVEP
ncbi:MAG TPA: hypothetical protein VFL93_08070 [Longimicrobiaceae bacterium]|nr:hypothetical protein [Longimicrobiaceae bacterium]